MTVLVEIARLVTRMIVMVACDFFLPSLVTVTVLVKITGLMARVIMVWPGFFMWHRFSP